MKGNLRLTIAATLGLTTATAAEWSVPPAGNAYLTAPAPGRPAIDRDGNLACTAGDQRHTLYFRADRPATLALSLEAATPGGPSRITAAVRDQVFTAETADPEFRTIDLGKVEIPRAGYVAVELAGAARIRALKVASDTAGLALDFVKTNDGNMFYWGRRGPSVHLAYALPEGRKIEYAYSELTVPVGKDPIGSYFMANGFGEGYFGIQVKSPVERWVLFSVWSPFHTHNPREVPEDQRVITLARGQNVVAQDFGGEGSGGQSFLRYPWKAGTTYRFLTQVRPDGRGTTTYTGWFAERDGDWRLIASFRRPRTDKWFTGFHSFLENFAPDYGHLGRRSFHGNAWVRDTDGEWHEITRARLTGDGTAHGRHRLDFAGGVEGDRFFMRNGGFFDEPTPLGSGFERPATPAAKPVIDLEALPRS